jgi:hypothetical protein
MTFWVLPQTSKVLARSTVWSLTVDDKADPAVQALMVDLDSSIRSKIGDSLPDNKVDPELLDLLPSVPDNVFLPEDDAEYEPYEQDAVMPEADDYTPEAYDQYLTMLMARLYARTMVKSSPRTGRYDLGTLPKVGSYSSPRRMVPRLGFRSRT